MTQENIYQIWLQTALGYANNKPLGIYRNYSSASEFYNAGLQEWIRSGIFTKSELNRLNGTQLEKAKRIADTCDKTKINIITLWDEEYPELLKNIYDPPCVIYYRGSLFKDDMCLAVVGTRKASGGGIKLATEIGARFAEKGITTVSGGALGIDTAAHTGAMKAGGRRICVLGYGLNFDYIKQNEHIRNSSAENGAVISEYPPEYAASVYTFPKRNRIISGLSCGTVVVEAGKKSGALITASQALEQGRDVFAVPGAVSSPVSEGTNELIKSGAIPVTTPDDIIEYYFDTTGEIKSFLYEMTLPKTVSYNKTDKKNNGKEENKNDSDDKINTVKLNIDECEVSYNAKVIYKLISEQKTNVDNLCIKSNLGIVGVQCALTELEIGGYIVCLPGRMYEINKERNVCQSL